MVAALTAAEALVADLGRIDAAVATAVRASEAPDGPHPGWMPSPRVMLLEHGAAKAARLSGMSRAAHADVAAALAGGSIPVRWS